MSSRPRIITRTNRRNRRVLRVKRLHTGAMSFTIVKYNRELACRGAIEQITINQNLDDRVRDAKCLAGVLLVKTHEISNGHGKRNVVVPIERIEAERFLQPRDD